MTSAVVVLPSACSHDWAASNPSPQDDGGGGNNPGPLGTIGGGGAGERCDADQMACDGACVDVQNDLRNCGGCDAPCTQAESCTMGTCSCTNGPVVPITLSEGAQFTGSTVGAEDTYDAGCVESGARDQIYRLVAPVSGKYVIEVEDASYDAAVAVLAGDSCSELACTDGGPGQPRITIDLTEGQAIHIVATGAQRGQGDFTMVVEREWVCSPTDIGSRETYTTSGNTADLDDTFVPECGAPGSAEAAFTFTAPAAGLYGFDTLGSSFDTVLEVIDGTCAGPSLGCSAAPEGAARVVAALRADQTVTIVVEGSLGASGAYQLNLQASGLGCAPIPVTGALPAEMAGVLDANNDVFFFPSCDGFDGPPQGPDAAYTFTAPAAGTYFFDTLGSTIDTLLYVVDGTCGGIPIACNDDVMKGVRQSEVNVTLSEGQTVVVVVEGFQGATGAYRFRVRNGP